jgi:hypothetical protein
MWGTSLLAKNVLVSEEGFYSVEFAGWLIGSLVAWWLVD